MDIFPPFRFCVEAVILVAILVAIIVKSSYQIRIVKSRSYMLEYFARMQVHRLIYFACEIHSHLLCCPST